MARPRKNQAQTMAEVEAEIEEEESQYALLQRDLREALVAGENTRPYRHTISEIGGKIHHLRTTLETLQDATQARRHAMTAATANEIAAESVWRHIDMLARLDAPTFPDTEGFPNVAF